MQSALQEKIVRARSLVQQQRFADAHDLFREICKADPDDIESLFMLGAVSAQLGRYDEAAGYCNTVIERQPGHASALFNLARIRMYQGRFEQAAALYRKVLTIEPAHGNARAGLQQAEQMATAKGHADTGSGTAKPGISQPEGNPKQLYKRGQQRQRQGDWEGALACYQKALQQDANSLSLLTGCGFACQALGRYELAAGYHERALAIDPGLVGEHYNLGIACKELLRLPEAESCYREVLRLQPDHIDASHGLGIVKLMQGHAGEAEELLREALRRKPDNNALRSCRLLARNYYSNPPGELFQAHKEWDLHYSKHKAPVRPVASQPEGRRLRVGYVSPDFCNHPVAYFVAPLLAQHDKNAFEVFCYSDVKRADAITAYFRSIASTWREVSALSDKELQAQIRRDRIDILVDLAGHTADNRLGVFTYEPAPVQVTYLGYPNTTGLKAMDYRLSDAWADPPGDSDKLHSEALLRLPHGFLCYKPMEGTAVSALPAMDLGHVTFGSFNNLAKVTPEVIALWARLLHTVPDSRLLLKTRPLQDNSTRETVYGQFERHGIERERIELAGCVDKLSDHLGLYSRVDIGLDTFPYNGTTTTCEAMWMGVPVITLAGHCHAGRVGVSLLSQVGLQQLIAADEDEYITLAVRLSENLESLKDLRSGLRQQMAASPLCDAAGFARDVESVYRDIWRTACSRA